MDVLVGGAFSALEEQMHFRVARHATLSGNLVNADTPGYRRVDLKFAGEFDAATLRMAATHRAHIASGGGPSADRHRLEVGPLGTRPDRNGVDLDSELIQVSRNAGAFMDQAAILSRLVAIRRMAISGA